MNTATARWLRERRWTTDGRRLPARGAFINPLSPTRAYTADIHAVRFIFTWYFSLCPWFCVRAIPLSTSRSSARAPPRSTQSARSYITRPLWLVLACQILLLHMWYRISSWRQRQRMHENGLVWVDDEVRASISPGPANNFPLLLSALFAPSLFFFDNPSAG